MINIEVVAGKRRWFWRVKSRNGQIILVSQGYYSKWNAKRAAKKMADANGTSIRVV